MFEEMQRRGLQPNIITWSAVISSCQQSGSLDQAIDLFLEAQSIGIYSLWLNPATIDLHDLPLSVARAAVASVLADVSLQPRNRQYFDTSISSTLTIITGRGNRSENNEAVLRPGILAMLRSEYPELDSTINRENDGRIEVLAKKRPTKPGRGRLCPCKRWTLTLTLLLRNKGLCRTATMTPIHEKRYRK